MPASDSEKPKIKLVTRFHNFSVAYIDFMFGVSDWIIALCGAYVGIALISQFNQSNLTLGIALIAILTALGSSCFGYARAIDSEEAHREKIVFSGERLLHGAVLGVLGAILKFTQNESDFLWVDRFEIIRSIIHWLAGMASITLFMAAVLMAITGLRIVNKTLQGLANRRPEWLD